MYYIVYTFYMKDDEKMKKIIAIAMCLTLMVVSFVITFADADATITIATIDGPIAAGEEIAIPVTITEWANAYATIEFEFDYDAALLKIDSIEASETDFSGSMSASNVDTNMLSLICNPSSERQANKVLGGEVCILYFTALADIDASTAITFASIEVNGYAVANISEMTLDRT